MTTVEKTFTTVDIGSGDNGRLAALISEAYPAATAGRLLREEALTEEGARAARGLFARHLPELTPALDRLTAQLPDFPHAGTLLTLAALRPFWAGCTQIGSGGELLRNYDFDPDQVEGAIVRSHFLRPVIGTQDAAWGLLDGMNDAGLAISLTFGGRMVHGPGFAVLIVIRYLLETCTTVDQALDRLRTIPIGFAHNLTLVDPRRSVTVHLGPDIPLTEAPDACAANHQDQPIPEEQERATRSGERLAAIRSVGLDVAAMLRPPLYGDLGRGSLATVYTAHYQPARGTVTYHWPDADPWPVSFDGFTEETRTVRLRHA